MTPENTQQFLAMDPPHDPKTAAKAFRKAAKALKRGDIIVVKVTA
jgi:formylmethanofuran dehydrogenase subunit A